MNPIRRPHGSPSAASAQIAERVAAFYHVPVARLFARDRTSTVAWARQVSMVLTWSATNATTYEIGRLFHRDHGTVCYALRTVRNLCDVDPKLRADFSQLEATCQ
jgi:chromosomal replication initiator protein